jgi:hypothetical protein
VSQTYGKLSLGFEANQGQVDRRVEFLSRGDGYALFLTPAETVLQLSTADSPPSNEKKIDADQKPKSGRHYSTVRMKLIGANPKPQMKGLDQLPGNSNYFIGKNPTQWRSNVPNYAKVRCENVYPDIDLVYYGNQRQLEYDFVVAPGTDPNVIRLSFEGADKIDIDSQGDLVLSTRGTTLRQHKPRVYQEDGGIREEIVGHYVFKGKHQVGFELGAYDAARSLVIDPVLVYSTFLGGTNQQAGGAIAVDAAGSAYVTGYTISTDFPNTNTDPLPVGGSGDVFVTKLSADGSALVYSTVFGGKDSEEGHDIAVDQNGNAYITGFTLSDDFPTANPFKPVAPAPGGGDAFITKLNATGSALVYSTYLGGSVQDWGYGIAVDTAGNAYVTGATYSSDFPSPQGEHPFGAIFIVKLNAAGTALNYSFFLGAWVDQGLGIAVDASGSAYVTGRTQGGLATVNAFQPEFGGGGPYGLGDAFVAKLNPGGSALVYLTYLGGNDDDQGRSIKVDAEGNTYITGSTRSSDFPTAHAIQSSFGGGNFDAFVAKVSPTGSVLLYSTYLGGSGEENSFDGGRVAIDGSGSAYVTGFTNSFDFPVFNALQSACTCDSGDAFVAKLTPMGSFVYSTYLGGGDAEIGTPSSFSAIAVAGSGDAYVTGVTYSSNFPTTTGALQPVFTGDADVFVTKISENPLLNDSATLFIPVVVSSTGFNNSFFTSELTLTNRGTKDSTLDFTYTSAFGGGSGFVSDSLPAGKQRIIPDAIAYLRTLGIPIPDSGNQGGSLAIRFAGLSVRTDAGATVRTTTAAGTGRVGLSYPGVATQNSFTRSSYLCGLRQTGSYRSNVAIQNVGSPAEGDVVLRLTASSGDPANPVSQVLPEQRLSPGEFRQISGILHSNGLSIANGYVRIDRVSGRAPYYAFAVVNDQASSDSWLIPPISDFTSIVAGQNKLSLPAIVESGPFSSELIMTNVSATSRDLQMSYVADNIQSPDSSANFLITLRSGEQLVIPNLVQYLRDQGISDIGPVGSIYAGALFATVEASDASGIFLGANTSSSGGGGRYGAFYSAVPQCATSSSSAWVYGLQQNRENRTNLALLNTGRIEGEGDVFTIEIFNGDTGQKAETIEGVTLGARQWRQFEAILANYAAGVEQGYARVTRTAGFNPFIAYAVINDGEHPGDRTGDGAFVSSSP